MADPNRPKPPNPRVPKSPRGGGSSGNSGEPPSSGNPLRNRTIWLLLIAVIGGVIMLNVLQNPPGARTIPYSELKEHVRQGEVESVTIHQDAALDAKPTDEARERLSSEEGGSFKYWRAARLAQEDPGLIELLDEKEVTYSFRSGCNAGGTRCCLPRMARKALRWRIQKRRT